MRVSRRTRERGQALFAVVVTAALVLAIGSAVIGIASINTERARNTRLDEQLAQAARSGLAQGRFLLWERYTAWVPGVLPPGFPPHGNLAYARQYLDTQMATATVGAQQLLAGTTIDLATLVLSPGAVGGMNAQGDRVWVRVTAERTDPDDRTTLVLLRSIATSWNPALGDRASRLAAGLPADQRVSETVLRYGGPLFNGFDFALLANAINCTFCHAQMDNSHRMYNTDPLKYGTFDRIKVASLESLEMRSNQQVQSRIAGTLYVQGSVVDQNGTPLTPNGSGNVWGSNGLRTVAFDSSGKIQENTNSNPVNRVTSTAFADSHKDGSGNYDTPFGNFYKQYPTDPALQIDGVVPDKFPPVVADENNNRHVDDTEWTDHITNGGFSGTVGGGVARVVLPKDGSTKYNHSRLPIGNGASGSPENGTIPTGGTSSQSVILVGTYNNPITIDGKVAIDGDLIISGYVKGTGQLLVRGNIYIEGDLRYADGADVNNKRTFGVAQDGTENAVAYAAGGTILHGSFLWGQGMSGYSNYQVTGEGNEQGSNVSWGVGMPMNQLGWWNRAEWTKSLPNYNNGLQQPTNGSTGTPNLGYEPGYTPRFYTMRESGTVWLLGPNDNHRDLWGTPFKWTQDSNLPTGGYWNGDGRLDFYNPQGSKKLSQMGSDQPGAYTTLALLPKFISESNLRSLQRNSETDRRSAAASSPWASGSNAPWETATSGNRKYKLDGLFYTNNAMLFMARASGNDNSGAGQIEFNGSVVAADTGILAPSGLFLNYDYRTKAFLQIEDKTEVEIYTVMEREGIN